MVKKQSIRVKAKNLFRTKTFQGATLSLLLGLAPFIVSCFYENRGLTKDEAVAIIGLIGAFGWALIGRVQTSPIYTPDYLPGPNRSDFGPRNETH